MDKHLKNIKELTLTPNMMPSLMSQLDQRRTWFWEETQWDLQDL